MSLIMRNTARRYPHKQSILVTGAAGFIGSRIVRRLLLNGTSVIGLVRSTDPARLIRLEAMIGQSCSNPLKLIACDLHNHIAVQQLIERIRPSACIHAAWDIPHATYRDAMENDLWIDTSLNLFKSLLRSGCEWIGSIGTCIEPAGENAPACLYARAKAALRARAFEILSISGFAEARICWWRVFQPYGPGEAPQRFIPSLLDALIHNRTFQIDEPNDIRDFIHIDDIASAISLSLDYRLSGTFDLGTGAPTSVIDVATLAAALLQSEQQLQINSCSAVSRASFSYVADSHPLMTAVGWQPRVDLQTGLTRLIQQRSHRNLAIA